MNNKQELQEALDTPIFIDIALPIEERRYQSRAVTTLKKAAKQVAKGRTKAAKELIAANDPSSTQWIVSVFVDRPGDYILIDPLEDI